jgi:hypothetical protein
MCEMHVAPPLITSGRSIVATVVERVFWKMRSADNRPYGKYVD